MTRAVRRKASEIQDGTKFNRWTVLSRHRREDGQTGFLCRCDCGTERDIAFRHLAKSVSCGCYQREVIQKIATKHGHYAHGQSSYLRWYLYGLEEKDFQSLLLLQDNSCAICKAPFEGKVNVDHEHDTGRVRGLLCSECNIGLGKFKDSETLLSAAANYLLSTGGGVAS